MRRRRKTGVYFHVSCMLRTQTNLSDWSRKSFLVIVCAACFCRCGWQKERPAHRVRLEQRVDANGRLVYRTFEQVIEHNGRNYVANISQEFDTAGRLTVEYGTGHPRLGKHYFYDVAYTATTTVVSYFSWENEGEATRDTLPLLAFREQRVWFDTLGRLQAYTVTRVPGDSQWLVVEVSEPLPDSKIEFRFGRLDFVRKRVMKIPLRFVRFDANRRLRLEDAVIVQ